MAKFTWLRGLGPIGTFIANILVVLTTNWGVVVSIVAAIGVGLWTTAVDFVQQPNVKVAVEVFLVLLWTYIGFVILLQRRKAISVRLEEDYAWGVAYAGVTLGLDKGHTQATLQIGVNFVNVSPRALQYCLDRFDVVIGNRTIGNLLPGKQTIVIPRGLARSTRSQPFPKNTVKDLLGKRTQGTVDVSILYGPPGHFTRRLTLKLELNLRLDEQPGMVDTILAENDVPLSSQQ